MSSLQPVCRNSNQTIFNFAEVGISRLINKKKKKKKKKKKETKKKEEGRNKEKK